MELAVLALALPLVVGGVMKVVGATIAIVMAIPFIIGVVIGWFVGRAV